MRMKFNQFLIIERLKFNYHDKTIKKIDKYNYKFQVDELSYIFNIIYISEADFYSVQFYTVDKNNSFIIDRQNKLSLTDTYKVFNKTITCMIYFIKDFNPNRFTFTTNDPKLRKYYGFIVAKFALQKPFSDYYYKSDETGFEFIKKPINERIIGAYGSKEFENL